jgi:DNA polymerase III subunit epsilon
MLDWLTGKGDPSFWKQYLEHFDKEDSSAPIRYAVFDCERTGLDWKEDVILSIGIVGITNDQIEIKDFLEVFIQHDNVNHQNEAVEKLFKANSTEAVSESEAMVSFIEHIKNATLIGHNTNLDIEMINQALKRMNLGKIKNNVLDINVMYQRLKNLPDDKHHTLDELCDLFKVKKSHRHTASNDAFITALLFLKLKKKLKM